MPAQKTKTSEQFGDFKFDQTTILTDNGFNQRYALQQAEGYTQDAHINSKDFQHYNAQTVTETPLYEDRTVTHNRYDKDGTNYVSINNHYQDAVTGEKQHTHTQYDFDL